MKKIDKRRRMKSLCLMKMAIDGAKTIIKFRLNYKDAHPITYAVLYNTLRFNIESKLGGVRQTPANLFRTDTPKIDKRRLARSRRGAYIVGAKLWPEHVKTQYEVESISLTSRTGGKETGPGKC